MYRFALRPAWILSHVLVVLLIVALVSLGFWQLRRHDQRADRNALVEARAELPAVDVDTALGTVADPEDLRYRPITASGNFVRDANLLIDNRSADGLPGAWVMTPLRLDDGSLLAVSRGFLAFSGGELVPPPPPEGTVEVRGTALPWENGCGVRTDDGQVVGAACVDRSAMEQVVGGAVLPVALQQVASSATEDELGSVPLPELDAGPHRSYAVQWFIFATIGAVGYPLILRRVARDRARSHPVVDAADDLEEQPA